MLITIRFCRYYIHNDVHNMIALWKWYPVLGARFPINKSHNSPCGHWPMLYGCLHRCYQRHTLLIAVFHINFHKILTVSLTHIRTRHRYTTNCSTSTQIKHPRAQRSLNSSSVDIWVCRETTTGRAAANSVWLVRPLADIFMFNCSPVRQSRR